MCRRRTNRTRNAHRPRPTASHVSDMSCLLAGCPQLSTRLYVLWVLLRGILLDILNFHFSTEGFPRPFLSELPGDASWRRRMKITEPTGGRVALECSSVRKTTTRSPLPNPVLSPQMPLLPKASDSWAFGIQATKKRHLEFHRRGKPTVFMAGECGELVQ